MNHKYLPKIKKVFLFVSVISVSLFLLFFVISCVWIGYEVKNDCRQAKADYGGTCTESLVELLQDESQSFSSRNSAIWALGQLGDTSVLPALQSFYTGNIPDKEPINQVISQYELKKAINLINGTNLTAIFWRYGVE